MININKNTAVCQLCQCSFFSSRCIWSDMNFLYRTRRLIDFNDVMRMRTVFRRNSLHLMRISFVRHFHFRPIVAVACKPPHLSTPLIVADGFCEQNCPKLIYLNDNISGILFNTLEYYILKYWDII